MSTTMFIPMPEWQALAFLRDRPAAFKRLVAPLNEKDRSEVSAIPDEHNGNKPVLFTYKNRKDAIAVGYQAYPQGFAMARIVIMPMAYGNMIFRGEVKGDSDPESHSHLYKLNLEGLNRLCQRCSCEDVQVMVDQIFPPLATRPCAAKPGCCDGQDVRDELRLPGPKEAGMPGDDDLAD